MKKILITIFLLVAAGIASVIFFSPNRFAPVTQGVYEGELKLNQSTVIEPILIDFSGEGARFLNFASKQPLSLIKLEVSAKTKKALKPIELKVEGQNSLLHWDKIQQLLNLAGYQPGKFRGKIISEDKTLGTWWIRKAHNEKLKEVVRQVDAELNFINEKLNNAYRVLELQNKLDTLSKEVAERESRYQKFSSLLNEQEILVKKTSKRKNSLSNDNKKLSEENKKLEAELKQMIEKMDLLKRITNRGQSVEIARRINFKESQYFVALWDESSGSLSSTTSEEQDIQIQPTLDQELEDKFKVAYEVQNLKNEIALEQDKINQLESSSDSNPDQKIEEEGESREVPLVEEKKKKKKGFWEKIF